MADNKPLIRFARDRHAARDWIDRELYRLSVHMESRLEERHRARLSGEIDALLKVRLALVGEDGSHAANKIVGI